MISALLAAGLVILFNFLILWRVRVAINRQKHEFLTNFNRFVSPQGEEPSPLQQIIIGMAKQVGSQTAVSIRAQLQQAASVDARAMNKDIKSATHAAIGSKNAILGMFAPKMFEWLGIKEKDVLPMLLQNFNQANPVKESENHQEEVYEYPT